MSHHFATAAISSLLASAISAQSLLWEIPPQPTTTRTQWMQPFADYDNDGVRDLIVGGSLNVGSPSQQAAIMIVSGATGQTLQTIMNLVLQFGVNAGDMDGDGHPDIGVAEYLGGTTGVRAYSIYQQTTLWQHYGPTGYSYGFAMLGNLDIDGDGQKDFLTITSHQLDSRVFAYANNGTLLYTLPLNGMYGVAVSLANLGDRDADGCDDYLVGINDYAARGTVLLVSGQTGNILRTNQGLQVGDKTCDFVSNIGDVDGDGVPDYAAFPWITAQRAIVVIWSGQTGQVIRTFFEFGNSVVVGEDFDLDGVPDIAIGADWQVWQGPDRWGETRAYSGRDGARLWTVSNLPVLTGTGSNAGGGWMEYSAAIGPMPGSPYPALAWCDLNYYLGTSPPGRVRAFRGNYAGQGPVTGSACASNGTLPLIAVRQVTPSFPSPYTQHTRITVAKGPSGGGAWLNLDYANATSYAGVPLPASLDPFGLTGCSLYVGPTASVFRALGTTGIDRGYASFEFARPLSSTAIGTNLVAQWLLFDPTTLAYAATQKHAFKVQ